MLKQRLLTAAILIPVIILATIYFSTLYFAGLLALFIGMGAWEWAGLSGYRHSAGKALFVLLMFALMTISFFCRKTSLAGWFIALTLLWWVVATLLVIVQQRRGTLNLGASYLKALIGVLTLVPAWLSLVLLHGNHPQGRIYVIFLLALIWLADSAAYFSGQRWGKTRLASVISPGKTWEGVLGAILVSTLASALFALATQMQVPDIIIFSLICSITVMGSIVGDLMESLLKRLGNVKDSGGIFPGHGGVMDRIDSLTAAAPIFLAGLWLRLGFE
ncbi:MAG: Phosphatidate cytidylyltransferase [Gammaproteobacteria bacterium]|nr:Phosphatidate cytidylyltransferase [Gammaproteobacteria bacterium]